jgi:hypothetical protein
MSRYQFELSRPQDDEDLKRLYAATPMDGDVRVRLEHDPAVLRQANSLDDLHQTIVCRDRLDGRIIGAGSRHVSTRYVNGQPQPVGYLGGLRCLPEHRSRGLVARGYSFLKELHQDQRTDFYLTTIAADNDSAQQVLLGGRAGLPHYTRIGQLCTLLCPSRAGGGRRADDGLAIRSARADDLPGITELIRQSGPDRQFFPEYHADDFQDRQGTLHGLELEKILVAHRDGQLAGLLAIWDQSEFRRAVIDGYSARWSWLRPAFNAWAFLRGQPRLPAAGEALGYLTAACPLVAGSQPDVFAKLLDSALERTKTPRRTALALGLTNDDPLLEVARARRWREYITNIFLVRWSDTPPSLDDRPLYLELGCL